MSKEYITLLMIPSDDIDAVNTQQDICPWNLPYSIVLHGKCIFQSCHIFSALLHLPVHEGLCRPSCSHALS
jgi:hypothetical protein